MTRAARLNGTALQPGTAQPLLGHKRSWSETLAPSPIKDAVPEEDTTGPEQAQQQLDTSTPTPPVGKSTQREVQQGEIWDLFSVGLPDAHRDDDSMQEALKVMDAAEVRDGFRCSHVCDGLSTFNQECREMKIPTQLCECYDQWLLDHDRPHTKFTQMQIPRKGGKVARGIKLPRPDGHLWRTLQDKATLGKPLPASVKAFNLVTTASSRGCDLQPGSPVTEW